MPIFGLKIKKYGLFNFSNNLKPGFLLLRPVVKIVKKNYKIKSYKPILLKFVHDIEDKGLHMSLNFDNDPMRRYFLIDETKRPSSSHIL